jgi:hypothetical protein
MTTIIDIANAIGNQIYDSVSTLGDAGILCILAITPFINPFFHKEN